MKHDLAVIVPSRGRPQNITDLSRAFDVTTTGSTLLTVAVDDDDPALPEYRAAAEGWEEHPDRGLLVFPNQGSMAAVLNRAARVLARSHFAVGFMGDDHRPRTPGWDEEYVTVLRELGTGVVYGNDLLQGEALPTQVAVTSDIIRFLGYLAPPGCQHMYLDNAWKAMGEALGGLRYLDDVVVEHVHPVAGKAAWDEGYARVNHPAVYERDLMMFQRWVETELPRLAGLRREDQVAG